MLPGLRDRAQRLLVDRRQPAQLVPRRRVVVDRGAEERGVVLPPVDAVDEVLGHLRVLGAPGQEVLAAVDLRRLAEHDGPALADDLIGGPAQTRVRGDPRPAIRAAALQRDHQFGGRDRLPLDLVGDRQDALDGGDPGLDGLGEAAVLLDREHCRLMAVAKPGRLDQIGRLVHLTAEAENDVAADIRMIDDARHRPLQHSQIRRPIVRPAAALRAEGDHTVDVRVLLHHLRIPEVVGDLTRRRRRAVDRGQDGDVIPRSDAPVLPPDIP